MKKSIIFLSFIIFRLHAMQSLSQEIKFREEDKKIVNKFGEILSELPATGRILVMQTDCVQAGNKDINGWIYENGVITSWKKYTYESKLDWVMPVLSLPGQSSRNGDILLFKAGQSINHRDLPRLKAAILEDDATVHRFDFEFHIQNSNTGSTFQEKVGADSDLE